MLSFEQCFILFSSFPLLLAFDVGGLGFEFCVLVAGWRALRSAWPFIPPPSYSLQFTGLLGQSGSLGKSTSVHNSTQLLIGICLQNTLEIQSGKPP